MENQKHTPEPWGDKTHTMLFRNGGGVDFKLRVNDFARASACVNACKGVENEWLQTNGVQALIEERDELAKKWDLVKHLELDAYHQMKEQRDELLEALREAVKYVSYSRQLEFENIILKFTLKPEENGN